MKLLKLPSQEQSSRWLVSQCYLSSPLQKWRSLLFICLAGSCLTSWISPSAGLTLGIIFALTLENPFLAASKATAKFLLQWCVVLLGFSMNLSSILQAGSQGMLFAAVSIGSTFWLGNRLRKWLKIPVQSSVLISAGTAICGGSAIAAVSSVIHAAESEISVAMGTVFILNAVALYVFPVLGHALHLTPNQFGVWSGIAIHDISSVIGAASGFGIGALETATTVKLSRSLWILPVSLIAVKILQQSQPNATYHKSRPVQFPWFIGLFIVAAFVRTLIPNLAALSFIIKQITDALLALILFLIGSSLSRQALKAVGVKPMIQGVLLWIFISAISLWVTLQLVN